MHLWREHRLSMPQERMPDLDVHLWRNCNVRRRTRLLSWLCQYELRQFRLLLRRERNVSVTTSAMQLRHEHMPGHDDRQRWSLFPFLRRCLLRVLLLRPLRLPRRLLW